MDGPKDQKRSIREGDSLNVRFVILCTGYYTRDDRNFSCFSFNRRVTLRYLKISEEFLDPISFFFSSFFLFHVTYIANTSISIPLDVNKV